MKVLVTGAAGNIAYAILFGIGRGKLLDDKTPIDLVLLDIPQMAEKMKGVVMELKDCAFPLLSSITSTTNYETAFTGVESLVTLFIYLFIYARQILILVCCYASQTNYAIFNNFQKFLFFWNIMQSTKTHKQTKTNK